MNEINVIIDNKKLKRIFFLDKFIFKDNEYIFDYSEKIYWDLELYIMFASIDFQDNEFEQEFVSQLLCETLNISKNFEAKTGRIFVKYNWTDQLWNNENE